MEQEIIYFEEFVKVEGLKGYIKVTLTEKKITFEKLKGFFSKKLKVVDIVSIDDIKLYKNKPGVKIKDNMVKINTVKGDYTFICDTQSIAKKFYNELIDVKTGTDAIGRGANRFKEVTGNVKQIVDAVKTGLTVVPVVGGVVLTIKQMVDKYK